MPTANEENKEMNPIIADTLITLGFYAFDKAVEYANGGIEAPTQEDWDKMRMEFKNRPRLSAELDEGFLDKAKSFIEEFIKGDKSDVSVES